MSLKLNAKYLKDFINADEMTGIKAQVEAAAASLHNKTGLGNDFLGWVDLPTDYDKEEFARIKAAAEKIKKEFRYPYRNWYWWLIPWCKSCYRASEIASLQ